MTQSINFTAVERALAELRMAIWDAQTVLMREGHQQSAKKLEDMVPILTEVGVAVASLPKKKSLT